METASSPEVVGALHSLWVEPYLLQSPLPQRPILPPALGRPQAEAGALGPDHMVPLAVEQATRDWLLPPWRRSATTSPTRRWHQSQGQSRQKPPFKVPPRTKAMASTIAQLLDLEQASQLPALLQEWRRRGSSSALRGLDASKGCGGTLLELQVVQCTLRTKALALS